MGLLHSPQQQEKGAKELVRVTSDLFGVIVDCCEIYTESNLAFFQSLPKLLHVYSVLFHTGPPAQGPS